MNTTTKYIITICVIMLVFAIFVYREANNLSIHTNQIILDYQKSIDSIELLRKQLNKDTLNKYQFNDIEIK